MEIKYKDDNKVKFKYLKYGECFTCRGNVYMKIEQHDDEGRRSINACNLSSGNGYYFADNHEVKRVNASVVVEM